jgi:CRP-like cAMP-binding protein
MERRGDFMAPVNLQLALEQRCEKMRKTKGSVLFRRGEKANGLFVVLGGRVSLDLGVDTALARSYGTGALLGLPATLARGNYSMTATVTEDAELGFWTAHALDLLLRTRRDLCQQLLVILGKRMAENQQVMKAIGQREAALAVDKRSLSPLISGHDWSRGNRSTTRLVRRSCTWKVGTCNVSHYLYVLRASCR